jgi:acyl-CoA dehydrogenase
VLSNMARSFVMGLCGSHCAVAPDKVARETRRYYQQLTRFSAVLAFLSDVSMGSLGGALKRKEKLSARLGDILSMLYLCSATLKRYEVEGRQISDAPLMHWAIWDAMFKAQNAIEGVISNFPNRFISWTLRRLVFPLGRPYVVPSDQLGHAVAKLLIEPSATRDRLTAGMFVSSNEENPVGAIELALAATLAADPIEAKIKDAVKAGRLSVKPREDRIAAAQSAGIITAEESSALRRAQRLVDKVVRVDDFPPDLGASEMRLSAAVVAHKAAA